MTSTHTDFKCLQSAVPKLAGGSNCGYLTPVRHHPKYSVYKLRFQDCPLRQFLLLPHFTDKKLRLSETKQLAQLAQKHTVFNR